MFIRQKVVCWKCQRAGKGVQLQNVRLPAVSPKTGKPLKSGDYICTECMADGFYAPEKWNISLVNHPTVKQLQWLLEQTMAATEETVTGAEKEEPPAGEGFKDFTHVSENVMMQLEPPTDVAT